MDKKLKEKLIKIAKTKILSDDPSHDIDHAFRVMDLSLLIAKKESGDDDILIPAALFHDVVNYPKNHYKAEYNSNLSAEVTKNILEKIDIFPKNKIDNVCVAIEQCSFTKKIKTRF